MLSNYKSKNTIIYTLTLCLIINLLSSCGTGRGISSAQPRQQKPTVTEKTTETLPVDTVRWTDSGTPPKPKYTPPTEPKKGSGKQPTYAPAGTRHANYKFKKLEKLDRYNIVIMMPFDAATFRNIKSASNLQQMAVEFYAGALIALYDLKSENMKLDVHVYDTKIHGLDNLLMTETLRNADLIIGPLQNEDLRKTADFCERNNIALVSPLNPNLIMKDNAAPNYIQVCPSVETHLESLIKYLDSKYATANFAVVKGNSEVEGQNLDKVQAAYTRITGKPKMTVIGADEVANWKTIMGDKGQPIVFLPSLRKDFLQNNLPKMTSSDGPVIVGMPGWYEMDWIGGYLGGRTAYISRDYLVNKDDEITKDFRKRYFSTYGLMPGANVYRGYDIMLYTGRMMDEYGLFFKDFLDDSSLSKDYMTTKFDFKPLKRNPLKPSETTADTHQYENQFMHVLRYGAAGFEKAN